MHIAERKDRRTPSLGAKIGDMHAKDSHSFCNKQIIGGTKLYKWTALIVTPPKGMVMHVAWSYYETLAAKLLPTPDSTYEVSLSTT